MRSSSEFNRVILMGWVEWSTSEGFGIIVGVRTGGTDFRVSVRWPASGSGNLDLIQEGASVLVDGELEAECRSGHPQVTAHSVKSITGGTYRDHRKA